MTEIEQIKRFISTGKTKESLTTLINYLEVNSFDSNIETKHFYDEAILLNGRLNTLEREVGLQVIKKEDELIERNKVAVGILNLTRRFAEKAEKLKAEEEERLREEEAEKLKAEEEERLKAEEAERLKAEEAERLKAEEAEKKQTTKKNLRKKPTPIKKRKKLTEEEKKERARESQRRYRERQKKKEEAKRLKEQETASLKKEEAEKVKDLAEDETNFSLISWGYNIVFSVFTICQFAVFYYGNGSTFTSIIIYSSALLATFFSLGLMACISGKKTFMDFTEGMTIFWIISLSAPFTFIGIGIMDLFETSQTIIFGFSLIINLISFVLWLVAFQNFKEKYPQYF